MSRWPVIGKSRIAMLLFLVLSCMLIFQACSAVEDSVQSGVQTCYNPDITDVKLHVDCDYVFCISFHEEAGLTAQTNGFWVFFDDRVVVDPSLSKDCVKINWETVNAVSTAKSASDVKVYTNKSPEWPTWAPPKATQAVKIWISESIPHDADVTICFVCGLSCPPRACPYQNCPCPPCVDHVVWVNNDLQRCPQISTRYVEIIASSGDGGHVAYPPSGNSAPPDFSKMFKVGDTPTYLITGESHIIDKITISPICEDAFSQPSITYNNGTVQAAYTFKPLHCDYKITVTFKEKPVYGYLKYQLPNSECGDIIKVKVWGTDQIQPMLNFADKLYLGGNSAEFNVKGWSSNILYGQYDGGFNDQGVSDGNDTLLIKVTSNPTQNPETYKVTYVDTDDKTQYATVTILTSGEWIWAPYMPENVKDVTDIVALQPAWQMVTQDYLTCNANWEGLIGMVVEVNNGTYKETIEIDTPGVHLKNKEGASPVIDANQLTPKGTDGHSGAVFLAAGCTGIEGFTIKNSETNGILVYPSSEKCRKASNLEYKENYWILDCQVDHACVNGGCTELDCKCEPVPCCRGRINIVKNDIFNNCENGVYVLDAVILIRDNKIFDNIDDGIDAGCLFCGVECIDPEAITHSPACSEIIYNTIYGNGPSGKGEWEVNGQFTNDPTACGKLEGWTDAGIQIRCVGSDWCEKNPCCVCGQKPPKEPCEGLCNQTPSCDLCAVGIPCDTATGCPTCVKPEWNGCGGCNQTLYIEFNNVTANYHAGIYLEKGATQGGNIIIMANHIHENGIFGMLTEAEFPCKIDFRYNDIWCNKYWGVKNLACCDLIAKENFWGSPGGPSAGPAPIVDCIDCRCHEEDQRSDALGNGNGVSHRIHYNPWLYTAWQCQESGSCQAVRTYGSDSLLLQCGWNTLSVPVKLAEVGDTVIEIAGFGKFITPQNMVVIYRWDAVNDMWVNAAGEQLVPGQGYYIKMKAASKFPVLYNAGPSPGLPDIALQSGWNLIGAPWGIDRNNDCCAADEGRWAVASPDINDAEAFKKVTDALESIKEGNNGGKGVAIIVSPSVPGQYEVWSASVVSGFWDPVKNDQTMVTGDAYWVYMQNAANYAGFEITPFYFLRP